MAFLFVFERYLSKISLNTKDKAILKDSSINIHIVNTNDNIKFGIELLSPNSSIPVISVVNTFDILHFIYSIKFKRILFLLSYN